jgi:hypothetical protein
MPPDEPGHKVTIFRPYEFEVGQKIHIAGGPRGGDWQVIEAGRRKMKLKCPVSFKEIEVERFCYFAEEKEGIPWPRRH